MNQNIQNENNVLKPSYFLKRPIYLYSFLNFFYTHIINLYHFTVQKSFLGRVIRRLFKRSYFKIVVANPELIKIRGRVNDYADFDAISEVFVSNIYNLNEVKQNPDVIIDAGAHIGCFSLLASSKFKCPVYCFEPSSTNFKLLLKNISKNNRTENIYPQNYALGKIEGTAFLEGPSSMGGQINHGSTNGEEVQIKKLSDLVPMTAINNLLLKIDIEGSEWDVLDEFIPYCPENTIIFLETHNGKESFEKLEKITSKEGFTFKLTQEKEQESFHEWILKRGVYKIS